LLVIFPPITGILDDVLNAASAGWSYSAEAFAKGGDRYEQNEGIVEFRLHPE
jgi:hypothetical protein